MPVNFSSLDTGKACDQGADIELRHPVTNVSLEVYFTVLGQDSVVFKTKNREFANARLRREEALRSRGKRAEIRTVEDAEAENIELLAECTVGWYQVVNGVKTPVVCIEENVPVPFSKSAAAEVYRRFPFIYDQISAGVTDLENFLEK